MKKHELIKILGDYSNDIDIWLLSTEEFGETSLLRSISIDDDGDLILSSIEKR